MLKPSILKRPTTAYLSVEDSNADGYSDGNKGLSLKFSPANSNTNSQKNVRFSGVEFKQLQQQQQVPAPFQRQNRHSIYSQPKEETNREDYYELEKTTQFPNEIGLKKYYKKSKTVPCKQIKLVGLNDEFIVASQPIQRHIQRELQQQQQITQRSTSSTKSKAQLRTTSARPFSDNYNRSLMYPNVFRVAPSANQPPPTPKLNSQQSTNNTSNSLYEQSNITVSSFQTPNTNRPNNYYHWQSSENSTKSPNCEQQQQQQTTSNNSSSLNQQHNKIISIMSNQQSPQVGQLKSSLVKMNSKTSSIIKPMNS